MIAAYNPFEILNQPMIKTIVRQGDQFLVLQRFSWPGLQDGMAFIGTPYVNEIKAREHEKALAANEGKVLNLTSDLEKLTQLIDDPKYYLFLCTFRDPKWKSKILHQYQGNILSFLKAKMPIHSPDGVRVDLYLKFGRLTASIILNNPEFEFDAYDMIE
jgi:hypothetical protein